MHYRLYFLNARGGFADARDLECGSDDDALAHARSTESLYGVELWQGPRKVARMERRPAQRGGGSHAIGAVLEPAPTDGDGTAAASARRSGAAPADLDLLDQRVALARTEVAELEATIRQATERGGPSPASRALLAKARENLRQCVMERERIFAAFMRSRGATPSQHGEPSEG